MQIKRFYAKSMTVALRLIKEEFGPDAVILSARTVGSGRGLFGASREPAVEVTAAQDTVAPAAVTYGRLSASPRTPAAAEPEPSERSRGLFHSLNQSLRQLAFRRRASEASPGDLPATSSLATWQQHLWAQEVHGDLATEIIAHLQRCPAGDVPSEFRRRLESLGLGSTTHTDPPRFLVLVGPAGVGKTTTAIKLAAGRIARSQPTALLTLDDRRIGAFAQLRIYADILGIPLASAGSASEVGRALERFGAVGTVIVDTPGISPGEEERRRELMETLSALPAAERHLTLALNTRAPDLRRMADAWKDTALNGLIFTRLDETEVWGPALNLATHMRLPVSYAAHGPRIPEDLASDALTMILERLTPPPALADRRPADDRSAAAGGFDSAPARLVANRSSDLYHRPGCRWVRKIKPVNLIHFTASEEAESRHYIACRNCNPDQPAPVYDAIAGGDMRLAGTR
jgi:flagellar biosynthesis protein FlhF